MGLLKTKKPNRKLVIKVRGDITIKTKHIEIVFSFGDEDSNKEVE